MNVWAIKQKGFTIVELLIVIVVIGVLAAIVIVTYNGVSQGARDTELTSDLVNTGKRVQMLVSSDPEGTAGVLAKYHQVMPERDSAWVTGEGADNLLTETQLRWNDVPDLPEFRSSRGSTIEIIFQYGGSVTPDINQTMLSHNIFCIPGATPGGTYDYRPMSAQHANYDKLLYYDSIFGSVVTMQELAQAHQDGKEVGCSGHVNRWLEATT